MNILKRINEVLEADINYHTEKLIDIDRYRGTLEKLALLLQPEIRKEYARVEMNKLEITFNTRKRAKEVIEKILEETKIEKFEKTMEESAFRDKVIWHYKAKLDGVSLFIGPAIPNKKCKPIKKEHKYNYWVCETK